MGINTYTKVWLILLLLGIQVPLIMNSSNSDYTWGSFTYSLSLDQEDDKLTAIRFWPTDLRQNQILEIQVFPLTTISSGTSIVNLGKAWVTWTLNVSNQYRPVHAIYNRGRLEGLVAGTLLYDRVHFFALQSNLFVFGVTNTSSRMDIYDSDGFIFGSVFAGSTKTIDMYAGENDVFIYTEGFTNDSNAYFRLAGTTQGGLSRQSTTDQVLAADLNAAVIKRSNSFKYLLTSTGNYTLPPTISDNVQVGHHLLNPTVFDLDNKTAWTPFYEFELLPTTNTTYFYGLRSSIVKTSNNTFYEFGQNKWTKLAEFSKEVFDMTIVDIGLYLSPTISRGLSYFASGVDEDMDLAPDTLESYFGSLPTHVDTDADGFDDYQEIAWGTEPRYDDVDEDADLDGMTNGEELLLGSDPRNPDTDYGGAIDGWELEYGFEYNNSADDKLDGDNDGVSNADESIVGSNPNLKDTDGDQMDDRWEIQFSLDPVDPSDAQLDPDNDGLTNLQEYQNRSDPYVKDPQPLFTGLWLWILIVFFIMLYPSILTFRRIFAA